MNKTIVYIGTRDGELQNAIQAYLAKREDVLAIPFERSDLNLMDDRIKQRTIEWKEKSSISEYIRKPENINAAIEKGEQLLQLLQENKAIERFHQILNETKKSPEEMSEQQVEALKVECQNAWNGWFSLKDVVEGTNLSYKNAREVLDMLFAFGFLATREEEGNTRYILLLNPEMQYQYISLLIKEKEDDIDTLSKALKSVSERIINTSTSSDEPAIAEEVKPKRKSTRKKKEENQLDS